MNKLEYIPGDIVKIEYGEATGKIGFVTNTFLRRKGCYSLVVFIGKGFQGSSKDDWIQTYNDEVSPIPLTPEILEKNGWDKLNKIPINCTILYKSHQGLMIGYNINSKTFIYDFGVNLQRKIKFIHQLQHLLFGLGLNSEMEV